MPLASSALSFGFWTGSKFPLSSSNFAEFLFMLEGWNKHPYSENPLAENNPITQFGGVFYCYLLFSGIQTSFIRFFSPPFLPGWCLALLKWFLWNSAGGKRVRDSAETAYRCSNVLNAIKAKQFENAVRKVAAGKFVNNERQQCFQKYSYSEPFHILSH